MNITLKQARELRELLLTASSEDFKNGWKSILNKDISNEDISNEEVLSEDNEDNFFNEDVKTKSEK